MTPPRFSNIRNLNLTLVLTGPGIAIYHIPIYVEDSRLVLSINFMRLAIQVLPVLTQNHLAPAALTGCTERGVTPCLTVSTPSEGA